MRWEKGKEGNEIREFSEVNLEVMLAKRFNDAEFGSKVDAEILKRFTQVKTVMFTDIVGFSTKASEKQLIDTVALLTVHDNTLLPTIAKYHGQLIKKIGDALMIKFDSAMDACSAAKEMQKALNVFNRNSSEKILIRIGINTGEVFVKNQDIFGDAVNVACRMESMAMPGKIFLTRHSATQREKFELF